MNFETREERKRPWQTFSGGLGCGCLTFLLVGAIVIGPSIYKARKSPEGRCQMNLIMIGQAMMRYRAEHDQYPPDLKALVPKYLKNEEALQIPRGNGDKGERFRYLPPTPTTQPWEPVIEPVHYKTRAITLLKNGIVHTWEPDIEPAATDRLQPDADQPEQNR